MAYVAPNTTIYICQGVKWDNSYKHTVLFNDASSQLSYCKRNAIATFTEYTYQRVGLGKIRVEQVADDLYGANYMCFQNTNFGSKWFYAFITHVEYVNNITTEITYELDVFQTYLFDWDMKACFVIREHVDDDTIGKNVLIEPIDIGDIKCVSIETSNLVSNTGLLGVVQTTADFNSSLGGNYNGVWSGANYKAFTNVSDMQTFLQGLVDDNKEDTIVNITMCPANYYPSNLTHPRYDYWLEDSPTTIDGYTPRNNKLFCYPYNYLCVDSGDDSGIYRYEWFNTESGYPTFLITGICTGFVELLCAPIGYNDGSTSAPENVEYANLTEAVTMTGFPQVSWTVDSYSSWVANGGQLNAILNLASSGAQVAWGGAQTAVGNPFGISNIVNGASGIISGVNNALIQANKGATSHGTQSATVVAAMNKKDFYFKKMQVQADYAEYIDNFFTKYGYLVNKIKVPNLYSREHWNYIKTDNCTIVSDSCPAEAMRQIEQIFDNGITLWHDSVWVGDYSISNDIVS